MSLVCFVCRLLLFSFFTSSGAFTMLLINPKSVAFADSPLPGVRSIIIDRKTDILAEEWTDAGPHQVFCDATKLRTIVRIVQQLDIGDAANLTVAPLPGVQDQLTFQASINNAPRGCNVSMVACVVSVITEIPPSAGFASGGGAGPAARAAVRTITLQAISPDGTADPVQTTPI